jgi:hypothetical protein
MQARFTAGISRRSCIELSGGELEIFINVMKISIGGTPPKEGGHATLTKLLNTQANLSTSTPYRGRGKGSPALVTPTSV